MQSAAQSYLRRANTIRIVLRGSTLCNSRRQRPDTETRVHRKDPGHRATASERELNAPVCVLPWPLAREIPRSILSSVCVSSSAVSAIWQRSYPILIGGRRTRAPRPACLPAAAVSFVPIRRRDEAAAGESIARARRDLADAAGRLARTVRHRSSLIVIDQGRGLRAEFDVPSRAVTDTG